jgi:hypothetical protein
MGMYKVEVEGHYTLVLEVEADSFDEAESKAIEDFERDVDVVTNMGGESWDHTSIVGSEEVEEEPDWDIEAGVR